MFNSYLLNEQKKTTPSPPQSEEHKTRAKLLCLLFIFDSGLGNCLKKNNKKKSRFVFFQVQSMLGIVEPLFHCASSVHLLCFSLKLSLKLECLEGRVLL